MIVGAEPVPTKALRVGQVVMLIGREDVTGMFTRAILVGDDQYLIQFADRGEALVSDGQWIVRATVRTIDDTVNDARHAGIITNCSVCTERGPHDWFVRDRRWDVAGGEYDVYQRSDAPAANAAAVAVADALNGLAGLVGWAFDLGPAGLAKSA